jgi:hypothetical protein
VDKAVGKTVEEIMYKKTVDGCGYNNDLVNRLIDTKKVVLQEA